MKVQWQVTGGKLQNIPKPSEALLTAIRMAVRI
jgi:hypothetical protein